MNANEAKFLTDKNFKNVRNEVLQNVLTRVKEACNAGSYYCTYKFTEDISYRDYNHVKLQLESLKYIVTEIEDPNTYTRNSSFVFKNKMDIEIMIEWGSIIQ